MLKKIKNLLMMGIILFYIICNTASATYALTMIESTVSFQTAPPSGGESSSLAYGYVKAQGSDGYVRTSAIYSMSWSDKSDTFSLINAERISVSCVNNSGTLYYSTNYDNQNTGQSINGTSSSTMILYDSEGNQLASTSTVSNGMLSIDTSSFNYEDAYVVIKSYGYWSISRTDSYGMIHRNIYVKPTIQNSVTVYKIPKPYIPESTNLPK